MNLMSWLRTSEFWLGLAAVVGQVCAAVGIIPQEQWDAVFYPAVVYIVGRLTSKAVKPTTKESAK